MEFHHITHPHPHKPQADLSRFWVVLVISNPVRYSRRYELFWHSYEMCQQAGVKVVVVESQIGLRPFMVTKEGERTHIQVRSRDEFWEKENLQMVGARLAVELGAREIAFPDADVRPARPYRDWFDETWQQLQIFKVVQMAEHCCYLDHKFGSPNSPQPLFMYNYREHGVANPLLDPGEDSYSGQRAWGNPGLAWAWRVSALYKVGGLIDFSIQGAADTQMALGLVGTMGLALNEGIRACAPSYARKLLHWQTLCSRWIKRDVGTVQGMILHDWHGPVNLRGYETRHEILADCRFDPDTDLKRGLDGRLQLEIEEERQIRMRDRLRNYFRRRNEDQLSEDHRP